MWQYEGDYTLYDLMQKKEWPYNLEPLLFGRELNIPKGPQRRWLSLRVVMKQAGCNGLLKEQSCACVPCQVNVTHFRRDW